MTINFYPFFFLKNFISSSAWFGYVMFVCLFALRSNLVSAAADPFSPSCAVRFEDKAKDDFQELERSGLEVCSWEPLY
jgi:hypothetical protein